VLLAPGSFLAIGNFPMVWWQQGILYQIYPRSFQDSNGDGIGDLAGILSRLDYLKWLGIDAVWISPFYPSPMKDFGYDIADYCDVDPIYGSLADFDSLLGEAHQRGIRVILDFVPNHTSDLHPWFLESRRSRLDPRRDWYIWRDPIDAGRVPNNWMSAFGGSAWQWDEQTGQYYLHTFLKEQPDLNWRNPEVQTAMLQAMRFWMQRGVDGLRLDAIQNAIKDDLFRDNPPNPDYIAGVDDPFYSLSRIYSGDRPEIHPLIRRMREVMDEYGADKVLIGEIYSPVERLIPYYGQGKGVHFPYNFQLIKLPWNASAISQAVARYEELLPPNAWPNWVLGNHDRHRIASRVGLNQARIAAMLLLTLRGTPNMYYGDEIGMQDVSIPLEQIQDPWEINLPGIGLGRDPERTPMQWNSLSNAGFTDAVPWLPVADDFTSVNVASEMKDPFSILSLYRKLIDLRRKSSALRVGKYSLIPSAQDVLAYSREFAGERLLIALNLSHEARPSAIHWEGAAKLHASTCLDRDGEIHSPLNLRPDEGVILAL
jgi:alpha-glucosidase